ncbi:MAG: hypothetical protein K2F59_01970 [Eubacteriales bacterium]|nr:hypothetical protein [Eubacteriales bacterium]
MKKLVKLLLSGIIAGTMFGTIGVFANTNQVVKVKIGSNIANVNGQNVTMDAVPYIQEYTNVTMIPLRFVATALGIDDNDIIYDAEEKRVTINANKRFNEADKVIYFLNYHMGDYGYAELKNGRTYIPLRVLCDNLGLSVEWDATTKTATMKANVSSANNSGNTANQNNNQTQVSNNTSNSTNSTTLTEQEIRAMEEEVVRLVNEERVKNGLQPLQISEDLMKTAREKSDDMATRDYISHTDPDGYNMATELKVGENISGWNIDPSGAVYDWMNSEGHRANILNPNYKYIGVGYAKNSNSRCVHYWTQQFSR